MSRQENLLYKHLYGPPATDGLTLEQNRHLPHEPAQLPDEQSWLPPTSLKLKQPEYLTERSPAPPGEALTVSESRETLRSDFIACMQLAASDGKDIKPWQAPLYVPATHDAGQLLIQTEKALSTLALKDGSRESKEFQEDLNSINDALHLQKPGERMPLANFLPDLDITGLTKEGKIQVQEIDWRGRWKSSQGPRASRLDLPEKLVLTAELGVITPLGPGQKVENATLYGGQDWRQAIDPGAIAQGDLGDCNFLSAVGAVASTEAGKEAIYNMIHDNGVGADGSHSYTVTFPGVKEPVVINAPTQWEQFTFSHNADKSGTGIWLELLEKAHRKLTGEQFAGGGLERIASMHLLTGKLPIDSAIPTDMQDADIKQLEEQIKQSLASEKCVIAATHGRFDGDSPLVLSHDIHSKANSQTIGRPVQLAAGHVYSVCGFDANSGMIILHNPWGNNSGPDRNNVQDHGYVAMTMAQFADYFAVLLTCDR